ncbi:MAG: PDZ domain-containing protein [Ignavibacteriaceae bacterium]|nr:PDZ domain-containing protein [Ignavibacteriaceae bacterium]
MNRAFVLFAVLSLFFSSNFAQNKHEFKLNNDDIFKLPEVGAYIINEKNNVKIQFLTPEKYRLPEYKNVDLKKDDIIRMINGKTVKYAGDLKAIYDNVNPGNDIKLDIKRAGKMMSVVLKKAQSKDLPHKKMMTMGPKNMDDKVIIKGYGVLIGKVNEKPMIEKIFDDNNELVKKAGLKGGDVVTKLNGQALKTFVQFKKAYDAIKPGQDVNIRFANKSISFKKPTS